MARKRHWGGASRCDLAKICLSATVRTTPPWPSRATVPLLIQGGEPGAEFRDRNWLTSRDRAKTMRPFGTRCNEDRVSLNLQDNPLRLCRRPL